MIRPDREVLESPEFLQTCEEVVADYLQGFDYTSPISFD